MTSCSIHASDHITNLIREVSFSNLFQLTQRLQLVKIHKIRDIDSLTINGEQI